MPRHLGRGEVLSPTNPQLVAIILDAAAELVDPTELTFEILDISDDAKLASPAEVVATTAVNLTTGKLSLGQYALTWTVPAGESIGRHLIVWTATLEGGAVLSWTVAFDVVANKALVPRGVELLALVSDLRAEGVLPSVPDMRLLNKLAYASRQLLTWTGQHFTPEWREVTLDTPIGSALLFNVPIIAVATVKLGDTVVDRGSFVVYNRHMRGGEDDRRNPKIEFGVWPTDEWPPSTVGLPPFTTAWPAEVPLARAQKVKVLGVWGFTEPDGSPTGGVPAAAARVVTRLALLDVPKLASSASQAARDAHLVSSKRTREQGITFTRPTVGASAYSALARWTGDPSIDRDIDGLCRPIGGAVV